MSVSKWVQLWVLSLVVVGLMACGDDNSTGPQISSANQSQSQISSSGDVAGSSGSSSNAATSSPFSSSWVLISSSSSSAAYVPTGPMSLIIDESSGRAMIQGVVTLQGAPTILTGEVYKNGALVSGMELVTQMKLTNWLFAHQTATTLDLSDLGTELDPSAGCYDPQVPYTLIITVGGTGWSVVDSVNYIYEAGDNC